jgi:hypothetical protein
MALTSLSRSGSTRTAAPSAVAMPMWREITPFPRRKANCVPSRENTGA